MFNWFKHKAEDYFTIVEKEAISNAVTQAELQTSGEVRVYVESKCSYVNAIDRAKEIFDKLDLHKTAEKNAVIVYVAIKHRQLAVFADEGIYKKTTPDFWNKQIQNMIAHFNKENIAEGIITVVLQIGEALKEHFPYQSNDTNELPNVVVFGK